MMQPVKVLGLLGSLRPESRSRAALMLALKMSIQEGAEVAFFDPVAHPLPLCHGGDDYTSFPNVALLQKQAKAADAFILSTPEYHGGMSGVLKNTLDLLGFDELAGKVFGAVSVLGGGQNANALNDLRLVVRWVHGWMVPEQVAIGQAWKHFDAQDQLLDPQLEERLRALVRSVVAHARRLRQPLGASDLLQGP
ncbi:NADPH-dependent FMN reductase [Anthocerotibacter panamensis]|uniref:NADPH-dependent FMN reductase n=1 Tax=Anthocerotibacter panamensis TaxID=2857077 RepID=UPI001FD9012E|nr:NAD(P)H-dependent oxidoreductase [Anthocerotibacter panamensis]